MRQYYVYILASRPGGALYVGVTSDLVRRIYEHRNGLVDGFTKRYNIRQLVYFEVYSTARDAIQREKNMKHWPRVWKTALSCNPIQLGAICLRKLPCDKALLPRAVR